LNLLGKQTITSNGVQSCLFQSFCIFQAGWHINDVVYSMTQSKDQFAGHPELYDEDGIWINEELLAVKFVEEEEEEDDYY